MYTNSSPKFRNSTPDLFSSRPNNAGIFCRRAQILGWMHLHDAFEPVAIPGNRLLCVYEGG